MASVGSLTVEIAADIAKLRSGVEESQARLAGLERTVNTTGRNIQTSFESSIAGIRTSVVKGAAVITAAAVAARQAVHTHKRGAPSCLPSILFTIRLTW